MENKIQELTEKIYREGVEKGNEEAKNIIEEAKSKEEAILNDAQKKADKIIADAQKKAAELKKNTEAELKLFGRQTVDALKTEIANLITGEIATSSVKAAFADKDFTQKLILHLVDNFSGNDNFIVQLKDADGLKKYMEANTKGLLNNKIKIEQVNDIKTSFVIQPEDGSYKISFGEEEFISYFKEFLRPQLVELLFNK